MLIDRWFEIDFPGAREWMRAHPDERSGIEAFAKANPEAALEEALAHPNDASSSWARNFPAGAARANAIAGAIAATCERDASQVETLNATAQTVPDRDAALSNLAASMSIPAPEDAASRALKIADPALRRETLEIVFGMWSRRDSAAVRTWLEATADIPAEWKQTWLQQPRIVCARKRPQGRLGILLSASKRLSARFRGLDAPRRVLLRRFAVRCRRRLGRLRLRLRQILPLDPKPRNAPCRARRRAGSEPCALRFFR